MDVLGVVDGTTTPTLLTGKHAKTSERRFLDWTVNGTPLRTMLGWENPPNDITCMVSGWDLDAGLAWLETLRFEGSGGFPDGRAAVLVCQECGDLECGALSVGVTRNPSTVRWSDFGWQVPREEGFQPLDAPLGFEFDAVAYDTLLASLADRLATTAITIPASRRFWRTTEEQVVIHV